MGGIVVQEVRSRADRRQFLALPWALYRDDPNWIPPLWTNAKELVGFAHHPFYARNSIQTFLAMRDGKPCGRIAAILNRGHNERHNERRGFFGFLESVDDQEVADGLFDAVRQWFYKQGIFRLRGPTNPSLNHELGLLIDGFDSPPTFMMTYNPPYYERLLENYGFRKSQDLYAFWGHRSLLPAIAERLGPVVEGILSHYDVTLRPLDRSRFLEEVETFLTIYNRALVNTWGFVPMSPDEVRHMAKGLRHLIVPELAIAAELDGRVIGATFGLPDYNPRIRAINGRLFPFGFIRLLRNKHAIKRIRAISTNVLPEYQRLGIGLLLMHAMAPQALAWNIEEAEFSWVLESNKLSFGALKKGGAKVTKTYRLYDLDAEPQVVEPDSGVVRVPPKLNRRGSAAIPAPAPSPTGQLEVHRVAGRRDMDAFCRLPWAIYADDPNWVPPLLVEVKEFLDRRTHPFYAHGDAVQLLATRGGQPVGRLLVSDDPNYNRQHGTNTGCFGMFECFDDKDAAAALLEEAAKWLLDRERTHIMGPIDYSTNYPCGLLVDGFDTPPRFMMNHHRPYYAGLLESWGLRKVKDLYAWWFTDPLNLVERWREKAERIARRSKVTVRPFRRHRFREDVARLHTVYNTAPQENWGVVELTDVELRYMAKRLEKIAKEQQVLLVEKDGEIAGFSITVPDYNEAIRPLDGRLTSWGLPIGALRALRRAKNIKTARMVVLHLLERYRRRGLSELLILRTLDYGKNVLGYTGAELSWTLEDNKPINSAIEAVGAQRYKTYRIFEKELASP
ncbi:MAG: GNAT family N-acetyltransferase [Thermoguttaceae bacterium]|jgi:GNAT superfamily N-acetyltransferase|nr:GNAT family N-acetyltransferase [Thermoguttaceae bacterium]